MTRPGLVALFLSPDANETLVLVLVRQRANALYVVVPSTQLPRSVAGSTAALMFKVYKRFAPGVMTAEAEERNVGATGVPPPPLMNAELELRKAICACAVLASVMPASAPISSTARKIPRCQRGSACLRVVRVAFIVISSCFHTLPALACKKSPTGL